jgi:hypothetical protein
MEWGNMDKQARNYPLNYFANGSEMNRLIARFYGRTEPYSLQASVRF